MRRGIVLGALIAIGALSLASGAYQEQPRPRAKTPDIVRIADSLYLIGGSEPDLPDTFTGGNTVVWITAAGVVVVDQKNPTWGQTILDAIKTVTDKPVVMLLNSHGHSDHAGSNVEFPMTVERVVHENIRDMWAQSSCSRVGNCQAFAGENAKFLPKRTFKDKMSLLDGKDQVDLYYFGRGHTDGDTWVVFPAARAVHVGDLFRPKMPPFIDVENGGSGLDFPETLAKGVDAITGLEVVIPGHGPIMTWDDMKTHRDYMRHFVDYARDGYTAGKGVDELAAGYVVPTRFKGYLEGRQNDRRRVKDDIGIVYDELRK